MLTGVIINIVSTGLIMGSSGLKCGYYTGVYYEVPGYTEIYVCDVGDGKTEFYKQHEIGHYVWRKVLTEEQRKQYTRAYERDKKKGIKWFYRPYSMSSVDEDFADNYAIKGKRQNFRIQQRINLINTMVRAY